MTRRVTLLASFALAAGLLVALWSTRGDIGFVRDEGYYDRAAMTYAAWMKALPESLEVASIRHHFGTNREHPVLVKNLMAVSALVLHEGAGLVSRPEAERLVGMGFAALAAVLVFLLGRDLFGGPWRGVLAAVLLFATPRVFFHAHLMCFDVAMTAMWLAVVYAFRRGLVLRTGVLFGLALATKLNAFFLPPLLLVDHLARRPRPWLRPFPWIFVSMAVLGIVVFFVHWPWLWISPVRNFQSYLLFHLRHESYTVEYFGAMKYYPPFPVGYPFVMTAMTLELPTLVAAVAGLAMALARWRRARRADDLLLVTGALWPILIIAWPWTPIFGGIKHWLPAFPFLCLAAADAVCTAARPLGRAAPLLAALVVTPSVMAIASVHPHYTAHHASQVGGPAGAATLGMHRQYWGYEGRAALALLNERAPRGAAVYFHETNHDAVRMYKDAGLLRRDVRAVSGVRDADVVLYDVQRQFYDVEYATWQALGTRRPVAGVWLDEVPLLKVYAREGVLTRGGE